MGASLHMLGASAVLAPRRRMIEGRQKKIEEENKKRKREEMKKLIVSCEMRIGAKCEIQMTSLATSR